MGHCTAVHLFLGISFPFVLPTPKKCLAPHISSLHLFSVMCLPSPLSLSLSPSLSCLKFRPHHTLLFFLQKIQFYTLRLPTNHPTPFHEVSGPYPFFLGREREKNAAAWSEAANRVLRERKKNMRA